MNNLDTSYDLLGVLRMTKNGTVSCGASMFPNLKVTSAQGTKANTDLHCAKKNLNLSETPSLSRL